MGEARVSGWQRGDRAELALPLGEVCGRKAEKLGAQLHPEAWASSSREFVGRVNRMMCGLKPFWFTLLSPSVSDHCYMTESDPSQYLLDERGDVLASRSAVF